jgi:putative acetyltransferase
MAVKIRPVVLKDAASYRRCRDTIAKERRYMYEFEAPPLAQVRTGLRENLRKKSPFLVAVDGARVVGWAVAASSTLPSLKHVGLLWTSLLPEYRRMGLGTKLMAGILKMCRRRFDSVTMDFPAKNKAARKLGEKMGFKPSARVKKAVKLAYGFDDQVFMQKRMRG